MSYGTVVNVFRARPHGIEYAVDEKPDCLRGRRNRAHKAGVNVRALNPENAVDTAMVRANCLYSSPVMPLMNAVGMNTDSSTSTSPMTGPWRSTIEFLAASRGVSLPWSTSLEQSSYTTKA